MNTELTRNEQAVLRAFVTNDFSIGDDAFGSTWANAINCAKEPTNLTTHALSGTVSSLVKKGWIITAGSGRDAIIDWASEEAFLKARLLQPVKN